MIGFPNAKINIGLRILGKREDGYHDIETVMYPLKGILYDALEITSGSKFTFQTSGLKIEGDEKNNLCIKAYQLLHDDFSIPPVSVYLHKAIPMGAGLGGGSADGAFMIRLLNEEFGLKLSEKRMQEYAGKLGSDCPFFIRNQPALAQGRGERLQDPGEIRQLAGKHIAVVYPAIHVSTSEAYRKLQIPNPKSQSTPQAGLKTLIRLPVEQWKNCIHNDFEDAIFPDYPELKKIKEKLYSSGAVYASMSGSGSAVYGIFKKEPALARFFPQCKTWKGQLG